MSMFTLVALVLITILPVYIMKTLIFSGGLENAVISVIHDSDTVIIVVCLFVAGILMLKAERAFTRTEHL